MGINMGIVNGGNIPERDTMDLEAANQDIDIDPERELETVNLDFHNGK